MIENDDWTELVKVAQKSKLLLILNDVYKSEYRNFATAWCWTSTQKLRWAWHGLICFKTTDMRR